MTVFAHRDPNTVGVLNKRTHGFSSLAVCITTLDPLICMLMGWTRSGSYVQGVGFPIIQAIKFPRI